VNTVILVGTSINDDIDDGGDTVETVEVYWVFPDLPGQFTTRVPHYENWQAIAFYYVGVQQAEVRAIYMGLDSANDLPQPVAPPSPPPFLPPGPGTIPIPGVPIPV